MGASNAGGVGNIWLHRVQHGAAEPWLVVTLIAGSKRRSLLMERDDDEMFMTRSLKLPASVALLVASRYALPGYGNRRVWVRDPGWSDHCVRL